MNGVNKVILVGTICRDIETRFTPSGVAVSNASIVTNESYKDKTTGQKIEKAEFHRVVFFNRLAEIAGEYLKKGSQVYIEGSLQTREWEKEGVKRYTTEIKAKEMQMLGSRGNSSQDAPQAAPAPQSGNARTPQPAAGNNAPDFEDDVPF